MPRVPASMSQRCIACSTNSRTSRWAACSQFRLPTRSSAPKPAPDCACVATEDRAGLWCAQTPQMFRYAILQHAFRQADGTRITDEAQAVEALGVKPRLVLGSPANIKVTYPERSRAGRGDSGKQGPRMSVTGAPRIGNGFDVHALVAGRRLVLGGVDVPFERGLDGHSDADVLLHAICDAILGAHRRGRHRASLSRHRRRVQGRRQPRAAAARLAARDRRRLHAGNVDATSSRRRRRLAPYIAADGRQHRRRSRRDEPMQVNVKATTTEQPGLHRPRRRHRRDGDACCCSCASCGSASGSVTARQRAAAVARQQLEACRRACARCARRSPDPVRRRRRRCARDSPRVNGRFSRST